MNSPVSFLTNLRQDRLQHSKMFSWHKIINALKRSRGNINPLTTLKPSGWKFYKTIGSYVGCVFIEILSTREVWRARKMRKNCSRRRGLLKVPYCEKFKLPWNQRCFQNATELFFKIKVKINLDFWGKIHELPQGCLLLDAKCVRIRVL